MTDSIDKNKIKKTRDELLDLSSRISDTTDPNRPPHGGKSLSEMKASAAERALTEKKKMNRLIRNGFRALVVLFLALISMQLHPIARKAKTDFACTFFSSLATMRFDTKKALKRVQREGGLSRQEALSYCNERRQ